MLNAVKPKLGHPSQIVAKAMIAMATLLVCPLATASAFADDAQFAQLLEIEQRGQKIDTDQDHNCENEQAKLLEFFVVDARDAFDRQCGKNADECSNVDVILRAPHATTHYIVSKIRGKAEPVITNTDGSPTGLDKIIQSNIYKGCQSPDRHFQQGPEVYSFSKVAELDSKALEEIVGRLSEIDQAKAAMSLPSYPERGNARVVIGTPVNRSTDSLSVNTENPRNPPQAARTSGSVGIPTATGFPAAN